MSKMHNSELFFAKPPDYRVCDRVQTKAFYIGRDSLIGRARFRSSEAPSNCAHLWGPFFIPPLPPNLKFLDITLLVIH